MNLLNPQNENKPTVVEDSEKKATVREALTTESAVLEKLKLERRKADKERYKQRSNDWKKIKKELDNYSYDELITYIDSCDPNDNAIATMTVRVNPYEFALIKAAGVKTRQSMRDILLSSESVKAVLQEDCKYNR